MLNSVFGIKNYFTRPTSVSLDRSAASQISPSITKDLSRSLTVLPSLQNRITKSPPRPNALDQIFSQGMGKALVFTPDRMVIGVRIEAKGAEPFERVLKVDFKESPRLFILDPSLRQEMEAYLNKYPDVSFSVALSFKDKSSELNTYYKSIEMRHESPQDSSRGWLALINKNIESSFKNLVRRPLENRLEKCSTVIVGASWGHERGYVEGGFRKILIQHLYPAFHVNAEQADDIIAFLNR